MKLSEIKKILSESRSNGIYFRENNWTTSVVMALVYLSKRGNMYMIYTGMGMKSVTPLPFDMLNMLRDKDNLVVWEGSV